MRRRAAWALLLGGCFSPQYADNLACSPSGACPPNQTCDLGRNVCVGAGDGPDASLAGEDAEPLPDAGALAPPAPEGLAFTGDGILTWGASGGADSYLVLRSTAHGGPYDVVGTTANLTFVDVALADGVTYFWVVEAKNSAGTSANSNELSGTIAHEVCVADTSGAVDAFPAREMDNSAPMRQIAGVDTLLGQAVGLAVDFQNDELAVTSVSTNAVEFFARTANGDEAPLRQISGPLTLLNSPEGVAIDASNDEVFVSSAGSATILVFARTASGNVAPLRTIAGPATLLDTPIGIALDTTNDELLVANEDEDQYLVFARTADGNQAPLRTVSLPADPFGIALDPVNQEIVVAMHASNGEIAVYDRQASDADDTDTPLRTIVGSSTGLYQPFGVIVDPLDGWFFVSASNGAEITIYDRTSDGNVSPLWAIGGGSTGLGDTFGLAECR